MGVWHGPTGSLPNIMTKKNIFSWHTFYESIISGPSKSLTFEEGVVTLPEGEGTGEESKKVPDPCCPYICERMWVKTVDIVKRHNSIFFKTHKINVVTFC